MADKRQDDYFVEGDRVFVNKHESVGRIAFEGTIEKTVRACGYAQFLVSPGIEYDDEPSLRLYWYTPDQLEHV